MTTLASRTVLWCTNCHVLAEGETDGGRHMSCGELAEAWPVRRAFCEAAQEAIPHKLISTPAVAAGGARRYKLADALWPVVQRLLTAPPSLRADARERLARHLYLDAAEPQWRRTRSWAWDHDTDEGGREPWLTKADEILAVIAGEAAGAAGTRRREG